MAIGQTSVQQRSVWACEFFRQKSHGRAYLCGFGAAEGSKLAGGRISALLGGLATVPRKAGVPRVGQAWRAYGAGGGRFRPGASRPRSALSATVRAFRRQTRLRYLRDYLGTVASSAGRLPSVASVPRRGPRRGVRYTHAVRRNAAGTTGTEWRISSCSRAAGVLFQQVGATLFSPARRAPRKRQAIRATTRSSPGWPGPVCARGDGSVGRSPASARRGFAVMSAHGPAECGGCASGTGSSQGRL